MFENYKKKFQLWQLEKHLLSKQYFYWTFEYVYNSHTSQVKLQRTFMVFLPFEM
jgi:hypothetical protein